MMEQKISISLVVKVVVFVSSLLGVWYNAKYKIEHLENRIEYMHSLQQDYNMHFFHKDIMYNREHIDKLESKLKMKKDK